MAGFDLHQYAIVAVGLGVSLMTLYSMTKIWNEALWKEPKDPIRHAKHKPISSWLWASTAVLVFISLLAGLLAEPLLNLANQAAAQLADPSIYIQAVLGVAP